MDNEIEDEAFEDEEEIFEDEGSEDETQVKSGIDVF